MLTEPAGTWSLAGRDMPPAEVLAADKHVDAAARDLKAAGAEGTLEQLRARAVPRLLSGRPLYTLLPGQDDGLPGQDDGAAAAAETTGMAPRTDPAETTAAGRAGQVRGPSPGRAAPRPGQGRAG